MWAWFYDQNPLLFLPVLAMLLFMGVFVVATRRAWTRHADPQDPEAFLPLDSNERLSNVAGGRHE
jgi:hypothetical protein